MYIDRYRLTIIGDNTLECEFYMEDKTFKQVNDDIFSKLKADGPYAPRVIIRNLSLEEREENERRRVEEEKRKQEEIESQKKFAEMCSHLGMWKLGDNPDLRKALEIFREKYGMTEELPEQTIDDIEKQAVKDIAYLNSRIDAIKAAEEESKTLQQKLIDHIKDCTYGYDDDDDDDDDTFSIKCPSCQFDFTSMHEIGMHTCPKCGKEFGIAKIKN